MVASSNHRWLALALLSVVQFMIVLDIAIVNVALPSIQVDLGFSQENLQWVISAYALVFGGFLLLGGRAADLIGRRRLFIVGLVVFTAASLLAALAWNEPSLIGARALQGLGAAIIAPAALSILMTTFSEGKERNIALGVWGAVGGFGAAAGVLLGGIFTDALSWEWIFFLNIPVGLAAMALAPVLLGESRDVTRQELRRPRRSARHGGPLDGGVRDHPGERIRLDARPRRSASSRPPPRCSPASSGGRLRTKDPLMSFSIFRIKTVAGANIAGFILGTALFSMFLMLTLYMQQVLGYSAMKTGIAYIAVAGSVIIWSMVAQQLVTRVGVKPVLVTGMSLLTVGLVYFTQVSVGGLVPRRPAAGLPRDRDGHGVLVRLDLDRGARRRAGEGRRARVRADQHVAADRRRARDRRALGGRDRAVERRYERGRRGSAGAHVRLPGRVLGRRGRRRGGRPRLADPDPQGGAGRRPGLRAEARRCPKRRRGSRPRNRTRGVASAAPLVAEFTVRAEV